jgi:hypothetical protein
MCGEGPTHGGDGLVWCVITWCQGTEACSGISWVVVIWWPVPHVARRSRCRGGHRVVVGGSWHTGMEAVVVVILDSSAALYVWPQSCQTLSGSIIRIRCPDAMYINNECNSGLRGAWQLLIPPFSRTGILARSPSFGSTCPGPRSRDLAGRPRSQRAQLAHDPTHGLRLPPAAFD